MATVHDDDPQAWLGTSPLLDLQDTKLRLRAQALTQLRGSEREKVLALYAFVKRMPFAKPFKMRLHTAREVLQQGCGDSADKATLLVALLRLTGVPARMRYLTLDRRTMRGLVAGIPPPTRPVVEAWRDGRWVATDTYIFDAGYLAAARLSLRRRGWDWGFGVHVEGAVLWNGSADAYVGEGAPAEDGMVLADHGLFCDPLQFVSSPAYRAQHQRLPRAWRWNMLSPRLDRAIRALRDWPPPAEDQAAPLGTEQAP